MVAPHTCALACFKYLLTLAAPIVLIFFGATDPAQAQPPEVPRVYQVSGISDGGLLNVRSRPALEAEALGGLTRGTQPIEVVETDPSGRWGRVLWHGTNAWVSMRYLTPIETPQLEGVPLPSGLRCVGTEPFWSFELSRPGMLRLTMLGADEPITAMLTMSVSSIGSGKFPVALLARDGSLELTAIVRPASCNDGMSEQGYGWSVDLLRRDEDLLLLSGCCALPLPK